MKNPGTRAGCPADGRDGRRGLAPLPGADARQEAHVQHARQEVGARPRGQAGGLGRVEHGQVVNGRVIRFDNSSYDSTP